MTIKQFAFNFFAENTYVVSDDTTKEALIFDSGMMNEQENQVLVRYIEENDLIPVGAINTHLHIDHILGVPFVFKKYGFSPRAHEADVVLYNRAPQQATLFGMNFTDKLPPLATPLTENDIVKLGKHTFQIFHVPGHSPGSLCFYEENEKVMLVGDVLFNGSVGRSDLLGGDHDQLISGIKKKLLVLPEDTLVYPGHGPATTIGEEKRSNPFLQ